MKILQCFHQTILNLIGSLKKSELYFDRTCFFNLSALSLTKGIILIYRLSLPKFLEFWPMEWLLLADLTSSEQNLFLIVIERWEVMEFS